MTTKAQYISQARTANPQPQYRTENGVQIELTDGEYEASLKAWADMKIEQQEADDALTKKESALASARAKLAKLGLTDDELEAFLGV